MLIQILINSILSALILSLVAIGFNLIFNATKVFHLAHGAMYVSAVYAFYHINRLLNQFFVQGISIGISIILTLIVISVLIVIIELLVYRPLYRKKVNPSISLISSLGVYLLIVSVIAFFFGNENIALNSNFKIVLRNNWFKITEAEVLQLVVASLVIGSIYLFSKTKYYTYILAISDNYPVAEKFGINIQKTRLIALIVGTLLVCIAGLIKGYEIAIDPYVGLSVTLTATVAVIIGRVGSLRGTVIVCFAIALIENYSVKFISSQWKETLTYVLLILVLLFYKQGLIAVKQRVELR